MTTSYVYVIGEQDNGPYKVGISKNPKKRLKTLQTGHPKHLVLHAVKETDSSKAKLLETIIHNNISNYKTKGEWFDVNLSKLLLEIDYAFIRYENDPILETIVRDKLINRFI